MTRRTLATTSIAAATVAAALALTRRRRTVSAIAPELRSAGDWLPLSVTHRFTLAVGRRFLVRPSEPVDGVDVRSHPVPGGLDVLAHEPAGRTRPGPALLWIHGGGTILGTPEVDHELCSQIAAELGIVVVGARYRLAPEHPFPAGLDDCSAALSWIHQHADEIGVDRSRVAVGGASAGGGLAAAVAQRAVDEGTDVAFQLLVYPMLDDRTGQTPAAGPVGRIAWTSASNRYAWGAYLGHRAGGPESRAYAVPARREDLTGLPPAWIGVGDVDLFVDEDRLYDRRLRAAGVVSELVVVPGMPHGADRAFADSAALTRDFRRQMLDALRRALLA